MDSYNKVSVVTVTYNCEDVLENTILSVVKQNYQNLEYIVIDGRSSDGTVDIIKKYSENIAYWVSEPDLGIYDAMNKGLSVASGDWIIFMNAGDYFASANVLNLFFENREYDDNIGILYGDTWTIRGDLVRYDRSRDQLFATRGEKTNGFGSCHQSIFTRLKAAQEHPFDLTFRIAADLRMLYCIYNSGYSFYHLSVPVAFYAQDGFSAKQPHNMRLDILRALDQKETILSCLKRVGHLLLDRPVFWYTRQFSDKFGLHVWGWRKQGELKQSMEWFIE